MVDALTPEKRSQLMAAVKQKDTKPEMVVRGLLHALGYRYRLHRRDIPGRPDIAFVGRRKAIFVHGCFWHGHGCKLGRLPKSRLEYWGPKIARNMERDAEVLEALAQIGWGALTIWQCEMSDLEGLGDRLRSFLGSSTNFDRLPLRD